MTSISVKPLRLLISVRPPPYRRSVAVPGGTAGGTLHFDGPGILDMGARGDGPRRGEIEAARFAGAAVPAEYERRLPIDDLREGHGPLSHRPRRRTGATEYDAFLQGHRPLAFTRVQRAVVVGVVDDVDDAARNIECEDDVVLLRDGLALGRQHGHADSLHVRF